jgi:L-asparaginase II
MFATPTYAPLAVTTRLDESGRESVESVHYGSIAVADAEGNLLYASGDPAAMVFTRSALKPFQAIPFVAADGPGHFGFSLEEIALLCASHSGEPMHTQGVADMLARIDCGVEQLQCGCHVPTYFSTVGKKAPTGARYTALHHNCSGKHTGMLAGCRQQGERIENYLAFDHPVQRGIRTAVAYFSRQDESALVAGIDGCSAPNYAMPLASLATAFARLAQDAPDSRYGEAPRTLFRAMTTHPDMVSGTQRTDLALMRTAPDDWVAKVGAEGVQALGVRSKGWGIAVKVADGHTRALYPVIVALLQQLDLIEDVAATPLASYSEPAIKNYRGRLTGHIQPVFKFRRA